MYFFLKKPNSEESQLILLKYRFYPKTRPFTYSTSMRVTPKDWDFNNKMPKTLKGRTDLGILRKHLQKHLNLLNLVVTKYDTLEQQLSHEILKAEFDKEFKKQKYRSNKVYFTDFIVAFIAEAPSMINRATNELYNETQIKNYNSSLVAFKAFEEHRKERVYLSEFTQSVYDEFMIYCERVRNFSVNYRGNHIKNYKKILGVAETEYKYGVHPDYKKSAFSKVSERTEAIALNESEIQLMYDYDFSSNPKLENCRDFAIIGFWTGMRIGDLMKQKIDLTKDYITVTPSKTKKSSGVVVMIPIHEHVRSIVKTRGMPKPIIDQDFNIQIKDVCKNVGIVQKAKGSLLVYNKEKEIWRKKTGEYEKYLLVSSHTMRRSFATNLYKAGFDMISIMHITGHKKVSEFLNYIKVPPIEHAQRLKEFWSKEKKEPKKSDSELLILLLKKLAIEKYGDNWKEKMLTEAARDL